MTTTDSEPQTDIFLYDHEALRCIADPEVVRTGIACFNDHRVLEMDRDGGQLFGTVEGDEQGQPLDTRLWLDDNGWLRSACDCGVDHDQVCEHAVALLCRYAAVQAEADGVGDAQQEAIAERRQRGRREVNVRAEGGEPWFGTWQATSIASSTHYRRSYQVHIRSLQQRANFCTCPDFATNRLGTCKHIEAVLHTIGKHPDHARFVGRPAPHPYIYLAWDVADPPQIRVQRSAEVEPGLNRVLERWFTPSGEFAGRLPEDFFRFSAEVEGRDDLDLGEDARRHVEGLAETASRAARAQGIRATIERSAGKLDGVDARLYPYQVEGVAFLAANGRALLADDMGLGKTLQAIAAATFLNRQAGVERVLVVCPTSLKHQWAREIERFTGATAQIIQGGVEARAVQYRSDAMFVIANYELVMRDLTVINRDLCPDLLILDEAQRIKNWRTKVASSVKLIASRYAFVLSGTPLENRLEDLYSLMQVVDPHVLGPLWRYLIDFHIADERGKVIGYRNLSELRRRIAPVMLRRNRSLVRDQLPERIEQRIDVPMSNAQKDVHDDALKAAQMLAQIAKRRPLTPTETNRLMAALQRARMVCDALGLIDKETMDSPKLQELDALLEELCLESGLKVVVFSQWAMMTRLVEPRLKRMGIGYVRLHGGVPSAKRGDLMDRFRDDPATQVFLSTDAGGTGLNLQSAAAVINLDIPWNPAVLDQRIARVHRLGQKARVQSIMLVAEDSYEQRVLALVGSKRDLFDNVVSADAEEDVVGVSRKALDVLVEDLAGRPASPDGGGADSSPDVLPDQETPGQEPTVEAAAASPVMNIADDALVRRTVEAIQQGFGARVERIMAAAGGLLVVLDQVRGADEARAKLWSADIPVALIDPLTLSGLERLGATSPVAAFRDFGDDAPIPVVEPPLLTAAHRRLQAARVLIEQGLANQGIEQLAASLLSAMALVAGRESPPPIEQAAVWLVQEALPEGLLDSEQATLLLRLLSLGNAAEIPASVANALLADSEAFVSGLGERLPASGH
jgi:superfamily II DNA or RNA helicase